MHAVRNGGMKKVGDLKVSHFFMPVRLQVNGFQIRCRFRLPPGGWIW
jgi:hypothetical protein